MIEMIKRDEVIKRQAQEFKGCVDAICKSINDKLSSTREFPISFKDNAYFNQFNNDVIRLNIQQVKNELFRILKEAGWTITSTQSGFELS